MSEIPVHFRPRRLANWINPTGAKKVHSLVDKVYQRKNLEMAWEKVKANRGSGGVDGQTLETFEAQLEQQLKRLHRELKEDTYQPLPVRQHRIPKQGKPSEFRMLGIPAIYDRVCQQALLNRLEHLCPDGHRRTLTHNPRFLRIQPHTQPFQYPSRNCQRCTRFSHRLTGNHPIVGEPRPLISFASHLLIKPRQKNVTEQWRSYSALWSPALAGKEFPLPVASRFEHRLNQT